LVRQQLVVLARLAAAAWRLTDPAESASAGLRGLEKALRRQVRVNWAVRLIDALRARLAAELEALDKGQLPAALAEARSVAADSEPPKTPKEKAERSERRERERLVDRERFGFENRDRELAEILKRPTAEIIALICRELGLSEDWPRLAEDAWARDEVDDGWAEPERTPRSDAPPDLSVSVAAPS
jgi:hypothetical protein